MSEDQTHMPFVKRALLGVLGAIVLVLAGSYLFRVEAIARLVGTAEEPGQRAAVEQTAQDSRQSFRSEVAALSASDGAPHAPQVPLDANGYFQPPEPDEIPDGPFGESIRRGREIFLNPAANATDYVGNSMACANCHLDAGRRANAAPMWAASVRYPTYRGKNEMINTMEDRVKGCFTYSMNAPASPAGGPPPSGDQIYKDLESYFYWLAKGAPQGVTLPGQGYPVPDEPAQGYDRARGLKVFEENCAVCHGDDGHGRQDVNGRYVFPPLWGPDAYNWGAGMHRVNTAAGFIYANMPLGKPYSLSPQEAWDVAAYINSHPRPSDPRQPGQMSVQEAHDAFHGKHKGYYNEEVDGRVIGEGVEAEPTGTPAATGTVTPEPAALR